MHLTSHISLQLSAARYIGSPITCWETNAEARAACQLGTELSCAGGSSYNTSHLC